MQTELALVSTKVPIQILGVNSQGLESGNPTITAGRSLPWLQDTAAANVEGAWQAGYRDVVVVDSKNFPLQAFNLTDNDLSVVANFEALKKLLIDTANAQ